jgi:hypothetical protein
MRLAIAQPCFGSSETVFTIKRSSVPCTRSFGFATLWLSTISIVDYQGMPLRQAWSVYEEKGVAASSAADDVFGETQLLDGQKQPNRGTSFQEPRKELSTACSGSSARESRGSRNRAPPCCARRAGRDRGHALDRYLVESLPPLPHAP